MEGTNFDFVSELAAECSRMLTVVEKTQTFSKSTNDFVTSVDYGIESLLKSRLPQLVDVPVLSEEDEKVFDGKERNYWLVDPLDGTNNFVFGLQDLATSVALVIDNKVEFGTLISYQRKAILSAQSKLGIRKFSFVLDKQLPATYSHTNLIGLSSGFLRWSISQEGELRRTWEKLAEEANFRNLGSQVMHAWHVAEGSFLASFSAESHVWDDLAARIVVEESGGSWFSVSPLIIRESEHKPPSMASTCFFGTKEMYYLSKFREQLVEAMQKQEGFS